MRTWLFLVFLALLAFFFTRGRRKQPTTSLDTQTLTYPIHWKGLMLGGSIISLWASLTFINRVIDGSETDSSVFIGIGFCLLMFVGAFLFLLETLRTIVYTDSTVELTLYFKKSTFRWTEIEVIQYAKSELRFFDRMKRHFSVPVNLPGFATFLSFAEDHIPKDVRAAYSLSLQNAREGIESAGRL
jgi:hypothetical protein